MNKFNDNYSRGIRGEDMICQWLLNKKWNIMRAYPRPGQPGGPRIDTPDFGKIVQPDIFVFRNTAAGTTEALWIEVKFKSAFVWHWKCKEWRAGIDKSLFDAYLNLALHTKAWKVYLLFLHEPGLKAKDTPPGMEPPIGVYGDDVLKLATTMIPQDESENNYGKGGMVYWREMSLTKYATWDEFVVESQKGYKE